MATRCGRFEKIIMKVDFDYDKKGGKGIFRLFS
jgi:hypothetical protein